jgi:oxygen-independent coproporphyrinogen-3 oxidase
MSTQDRTMAELVQKYNVAAPRYTSYPTVPFWDEKTFSTNGWMDQVYRTFKQSKDRGLSLYIHLPFCESLCTYCGCNTRITKNHQVELPYIVALLKEWEMYRAVFEGEKTARVRNTSRRRYTDIFSTREPEIVDRGNS